MKTVMFLSAVGAIAAAAVVAPGSGRAEEAAAAAGTSGVCFEEGLYAKGAVVDFDTKISGENSPPPFRTVATTKGKAKFEGEDAIAIEAESFDKKGKSEGVVTSYYDLAPGFLLVLGTKAKAADTTFDPAGRQPIDQKEGKPFKQKYEITTTTKQTGSQTVERQATWTFAGIETLKTSLGKFKVCKITAKFVDKFGPFSTTTNLTTYVASEGKYRGFTIRTKTSGKLPTGQPLNVTADVTKIRKFQPK